MSNYLENLNPKQLAAVTSIEDTLIIIAGPGSGKTRVITSKIAHLQKNGVNPREIIAVTFTNKAAKEMKERLINELGEDAVKKMWVSTFHSACVRIISENHNKINLPRHFTIYDQQDSKNILKKILKEIVKDELAETELNTELNYIQKEISTAKNDSMNPKEYAEDVRENQVYDIWLRYEEKLKNSNALDFDDLLLKTKELLMIPEVREKYQKRFKYILIDEFQDTNKVQYDITKLLKGSNQKLTVVGDLDQAIYSFRGARPSILQNLDKDFEKTSVITLDQNYRSSKSILNFAKALIAENESKYRPDLFTENELGRKVILYQTETDQDEARKAVTTLLKENPLESKAILVRTRAQTRLFERECINLNLSYEVIGALKFTERAVIKDALSYLEVVLNPKDQKAIERATQNPKRKIGEKTLEELAKYCKDNNTDYLEAMDTKKTKHLGIAEFLKDVKIVKELVNTSINDAIEYISNNILTISKDKEAEQDNQEHLEELYKSALSYEEEYKRDNELIEEGEVILLPEEFIALTQLSNYLQSMKLSSSEDHNTKKANKIIIITAHASKGKEFDHVWVAGVEEELYPHINAGTDTVAIEEERRLLYVAATRARKTLTLSAVKERYVFFNNSNKKDILTRPGGKSKFPSISEFLATVPRELYVKHGIVKESNYHKDTPTIPKGGFFKTIPAKPAFDITCRVDPSELNVGDRVEHATKGVGIVQQITGTRAWVRFNEETSDSQMELTKAPLKKVE